MIISPSGLDQPRWPNCNYRLSARQLCYLILSIHTNFQQCKAWGGAPPPASWQLKSSRSPEAGPTAGSQTEFAIPTVAFLVVVQTPPSEVPAEGAAFSAVQGLGQQGQDYDSHHPNQATEPLPLSSEVLPPRSAPAAEWVFTK